MLDSSNARRLIVNADDFGLTRGVNQGILDAHKRGLVTSTSVMVNMPYTEEGLRLAAAEAPFLGLGLHLNLTAGRPLSPPDQIPALAQGDAFISRSTFMQHFDALPLDQVENELRRQIERFVDLAGKLPDHLDSHHHTTYIDERFLALMITLAQEIRVPVRRPLADMHGGLQANSRLADMAAEAGVQMPDHFEARFYGDNNVSLGDLLNILVDLQPGVTELMCHPGYIDEELRRVSSIVEPRQAELEALTHPTAREVVIAQRLTLIRFDEMNV